MNGRSDHPAGTPRAGEGSLLLVANFAPDVGFAWWLMENFWIQCAAAARARGLSPVIAYPTEGEVPAAIREAGIETVTVPFPGSGLGALRDAVSLVRALEVKAVYFTDRPFTSLTYLLLRLSGVQLLVNHDHAPGDRAPVGGLKGAFKSLWRRFHPASCDLQIAVSPLIQERAIRNARIPRRRTATVQNGIEPIECSDDRTYAHRAFGLPEDASICISVCRANPYKRVDQFIEVARRCTIEMHLENLYFVHCGDGPEMPRLRELTGRDALDGRVILAGRRSDVRQLLCSSDYALHTSRGEAFSLAILEYMSAGLAVLVPDIPTVRQAVQDGQTGLVFPDGDLDAAAKLLGRLEGEPGLAARLGSEAAAEVRRTYSFEKMNQSFQSLIAKELDGLSFRRSLASADE